MLDKTFDPKSFEKNYSFEAEAAERKPSAEPFMILLPPPNVTGALHIGHSLCYTLQDVITRYKRLKGFNVIFQPGLDHAGIVTQLLVEKRLYESGVTKGSLTREQLLDAIWKWKAESGGTILNQMKVLGISCDFSRLKFTMDPDCQSAVTHLFVKLYKDGLIYRGKKMVNWDPMICSAISDLEVVEKEIDGHLWYIKYVVEGLENDYIEVATTRPETLFGDTAVAVHPEDVRFQRFIGKKVKVPFVERSVPVIADTYADPEKGSGAVKITPAHDFNDFEVGNRHNLPIIDIFKAKAELNDNVPAAFRKMDRFAAREAVVKALEEQGLLVKSESIKQMVPFGDRSGVILEPRITNQWFIDAKKLAKKAIEVVKDGRIEFVPKHWENLYFEWLENIRPWCVSRQIWWGHRIPAWYGPDGRIFVAETEETALEEARAFYEQESVDLKRDDDVLDTWFSSGMWPFVTLNWPDNTADFQKFYSHEVVVTGFDIIFFWVARMIMLGLYATEEVPFRKVYIHALVRDTKGQKMSKSKGNVIDPLLLCDKYGADAVRYTLASMASPGRDIRMDERKAELGRNFLTKLWNVVRFAQMNQCNYKAEFDPNKVTNDVAQWIIYRIKSMVNSVESALDNYRFDEASRSIYQCLWGDVCDWYTELIKPVLQGKMGDDASESSEASCCTNKNLEYVQEEIRNTTAWVIAQIIKVLYPFTPFISKKLSEELGIGNIAWPDTNKLTLNFEQSVERVEKLKEIVIAVRSMKKYMNMPASKKIAALLETKDPKIAELVRNNATVLNQLAGISMKSEINSCRIPVIAGNAVIYLEFDGNLSIEDEIARLNKEISKLEKLKEDTVKRLSNPDFIEKAGDDVVQEHKGRVSEIETKISSIRYVLESLGGM